MPSSLATVPTVPIKPLHWHDCFCWYTSLLSEYRRQNVAYLYLGTPSDFACSCSLTLAVSSGKVAICNQGSKLKSGANEVYRSDEVE